MMRFLGKSRLCQIALVALASVTVANSDAAAWSYVSYGYGLSGNYACCDSYVCYGSYGGGLFQRIRARRTARIAARIAARSCYSCYGYCSCGCCGCYDPCSCYGTYAVSYPSVSYPITASCDSCVGTSYSTPVEVHRTPVESAVPTPAETPAVPEPVVAPAEDSAAINVTLPANAKVFVNDVATTSTGSSRSYVSKGLQQGRTYSYQLRVEFDRDGETVVVRKVVQLSLGDKVELSFGNADQEQLAVSGESVKTVLNVAVPANAKVFLSDAATKQTGEKRSFVTQRLAAGEQWDGYTIRVELEQDGKTLVQERELSIEGGESYELAFNFDQQDVLHIAQID